MDRSIHARASWCGQRAEPTIPEGTFYIVARSPIPDDARFVDHLASKGLFVLPGSIVALPGWFRISLTGSDAMVEASIEGFASARSLAVVAP